MSLDDLYQQVILDHYKNPRNRGVADEADALIEMKNPSCGDTIRLSLAVDDQGRIRAVRFLGDGCSISQASASIMTEVTEGLSVAEAHQLAGQVKAMLRGEGEVPESAGDMAALVGVRKFPSRVKCATLAWNALEKALQESTVRGGQAGDAGDAGSTDS